MSKENAFESLVEKVFEGFRKITPALVALFIVSGFILFSPEGVLVKLGLNTLPSYVRVVIGLVFLLTVALIITLLVSSLSKGLRRWRLVREKIKDCRSLSEEQKKIMKSLLASKDKAVSYESTNGNIVFLKSKRFICHPQQVVDFIDMSENKMKYCPQPWVFELIEKKPGIFD